MTVWDKEKQKNDSMSRRSSSQIEEQINQFQNLGDDLNKKAKEIMMSSSYLAKTKT